MNIDSIKKYMNILFGSVVLVYLAMVVILVLGCFFPGNLSIGAFTIPWPVASTVGLAILHMVIILFVIVKYNREKKSTLQND